jgi:hypothetical protein
VNPMATLPKESEPEDNWFTFADWYLGLFPYIEHDEAPPEAAWALSATFEETRENYKQAEAPFVSQIESVIRKLCETGSASAPSKAVAYFLGCRSAVLESFFFKLSIGDSFGRSLTIIPFPSLPRMRVAQWFLIDWWRHHGASETCYQRYKERWYAN